MESLILLEKFWIIKIVYPYLLIYFQIIYLYYYCLTNVGIKNYVFFFYQGL